MCSMFRSSFLSWLFSVPSACCVAQGETWITRPTSARFLANFFPPDFSVTGQTLIGLWETFEIAVMATAFAIVISMPIAMAGAQTLSPRWLVFISRLIMNGIRTIPSLIWALLAVAIVGANPLAGVIGLTFYSVGYLGKFFSDAFESVHIDVARALRALERERFRHFNTACGRTPNRWSGVTRFGCSNTIFALHRL